MKLYLWVGLAGALGAISRYVLSLLMAMAAPSPFPLGTLVVNLTGSFLLGFAVGHLRVPEPWRIPVTTGFLGAYTTFSTWTVETVMLYRNGLALLAAANVILSLLLGPAMVWLGLRMAAPRFAGRDR